MRIDSEENDSNMLLEGEKSILNIILYWTLSYMRDLKLNNLFAEEQCQLSLQVISGKQWID